MAEITKNPVWHMKEHYWDLTVEVNGNTYNITCKKDTENNSIMKCVFEQKNKSLFEVIDCIDTICSDWLVASDFKKIAFLFNGTNIVVDIPFSFGNPLWKQIACQIFEA